MNTAKYQEEVQRTTPDVNMPEHALILGALGLAGESGEVVDLIKKHTYHGHKLDMVEMRKELGDVLWYLVYLCDQLDTTLDEVMHDNVAKLRARYPHGFSNERSINRAE